MTRDPPHCGSPLELYSRGLCPPRKMIKTRQGETRPRMDILWGPELVEACGFRNPWNPEQQES